MQNEDALKISIANSSTWEDAISDFITCTTQLGQALTSGHITTILRVYRPDFRFSHFKIGEIVQEKLFAGEIEYNGQPATQVSRVCAGLGRTPEGTAVFCIGPDPQACQDFPFELDIPEPGAGLKQMPQEHPIQQGVTIAPKAPSKADMKATVHSDHRLCVPRVAFEALMHKTGQSFRAGDRAWVRFEDGPDRAIVSLSQQSGAVDYDIGKDRGRILFPKAGSGQFQHGDIFAIEIANNELVVAIDRAL